jgi:alpha-glucosidase
MQHAALAVRHLSLLLVLLALPALLWSAEVRSPDGSIRFSIEVDDKGAPFYKVDYRDETAVRRSRLGMRFEKQHPFDDGFRIVTTHDESSDTSWEQPWGERRTVVDRHNELLVEFASMDRPLRRFNLRVRVFDDGVGFRYEIPKQSEYSAVNIVDELTEFHLPGEATAWWIPGRRFNRYEYLYNTTGLEEIQTAHTPMTVRLPSGIHLSIHEAALVDYAAFVLDQRRPGVFQANLTPWSDGIRVRTKTPFHTPWRTIQIAPDAVGLLNSDLILNLNEPNALGDVSWVKPGKYVGIWWGMHIGANTWGSGPTHGATTEETKKYIDFASKHGIDGVLVEGWNSGWDGDWYSNGDVFSFTEAYPDFDLQVLSAYAEEKGVELIGHHETSGAVTNYEKQMGDAYDLYQSLGVHKVKTGYVADAGGIKRIDAKGIAHYEWHDGQFTVNHHLRAVREAAKRKISLNPHEPIKDTGLRRTYPNWISREGARGQEYNAWGEPPNPPEHTAILPYTRMLSGPMDFTPGIFDLTFKGADSPFRVQTTLAKQLALYVVLYSPIQMAADLPENYEQKPEAFQFIVDVPTDWEQSIAVAGEVGDFVAFARKERDGTDWYLGALTDETARQLSIPLSFLDADATYMAEIYRDGDGAHWKSDPYDLVIEEQEFSKDDLLELPLAAGGGAAVRFRMAE